MNKNDYFAFNSWWEGRSLETGILRGAYISGLEKRLPRKQIELITGGRRVGKTTILKQIVAGLLKNGVEPEEIFYVSCDYARAIGVSVSDHLTVFRQIFSHGRGEKLYLFFDEVQNSPNWQAELKSLYDSENLKIFCSGSTSALISSHGGKLTGRQINTVVYPLDFREFLEFRRVKVKKSESYLLEAEAEKYLNIGGYPEQVLTPSDEYLSSLLEDIFARDLGRIYPIRNPGIVRDLYKLLAASVGSRTSFNKLAKVLEISVDTVKDYINYFEASFLVGKLEAWSSSFSKRAYAPKKTYLLDNGLKTLMTGDGDLGAKAETAVFWKLKKENQKLGYLFENNKEVDFVTERQKIEVKYTSDRQKLPKDKDLLVVTKNLEGKNLIPLWEFLLEK
ncbi:MAG: ATP-binding protein [Patescibacteria group bacterium]